MTVTLAAAYHDRTAITFSARGREQVNIRALAEDGTPTGFTSTELLLIALGNCSLGWLTNHDLLAAEPLAQVHATVEAEMADAPPRLARVHTVIDLVVEDPALLAQRAELEAIACACPICNSLTAEKTVELRMRLARAE